MFKCFMSAGIVNTIINAFGGLTSSILGQQILVFIISLLPILELRGGLLAASLLGLDALPSYIITMVRKSFTYSIYFMVYEPNIKLDEK